MTTKCLVPLEANPSVFNKWLANAGVTGYEFQDVYSLDPEMLEFLPRPVAALVIALPISESYENHRKAEDGAVCITAEDYADAIWYPQTIDNSCGSMALLHAISNALPQESIGEPLRTILAESEGLLPLERAKYIHNNAVFEQLHCSCAAQGDTAAPAAEDNVEFHYVTLTKSKSLHRLVELDGRRIGPLIRGGAIEDLLDPAAVAYVQGYIDRELATGGAGSFSVLALCAL